MRAAPIVLLIYFCAAYHWNGPWYWTQSLGGYYNYLAKAFSQRQLHLPIEPHPKLLSAPNPYDPALPDEWKLHDAAFFNQRFYLYHGIAPALLLFTPYRLATNADLPESFAVALLLSLSLLLQCATLRPSIGKLSPWHVLALGLANTTPFLLHRVWVYEVAIACGIACLSLAALAVTRQHWSLAGLAIGLAILSRPHLGLAALPALWLAKRHAIRVLAPLAGCLLLLATYNYARFANPLEFGLTYLLSGPGQQSPQFSLSAAPTALYLYFLQPPTWIHSFPYLVLQRELPFHSDLPIFHEFTIGLCFLCPILLAIRRSQGFATVTALSILAFHLTTGWVTQRYTADFVPLLILAAMHHKVLSPLHRCLNAISILANLYLLYLGPNGNGS
jgi:hypothetical protein